MADISFLGQLMSANAPPLPPTVKPRLPAKPRKRSTRVKPPLTSELIVGVIESGRPYTVAELVGLTNRSAPAVNEVLRVFLRDNMVVRQRGSNHTYFYRFVGVKEKL